MHYSEVAALKQEIRELKAKLAKYSHKSGSQWQESSQFLKLIINKISQLVFWKNIDGKYLGCNQAFAEANNLERPEDVIGKTDWELSGTEEEQKYILFCDHFVRDTNQLLYNNLQSRSNSRGEKIWYETNTIPLRDQDGAVIGTLGTARNVTAEIHQKNQREKYLNLIFEGTASKVETEFFHSCVASIAKLVSVDYVLITEYANAKKNRVRTLAFWAKDHLASNVEYELEDTACGLVYYHNKLCKYLTSVREEFPQSEILANLEAESYLGLPIQNVQGEVIGNLAIIHTKHLPKNIHETILRIFTARIAAELERKRANEILAQQLQAEQLLSKITQEIRLSLDTQTIFETTVNLVGQTFKASRCHILVIDESQEANSIVAEYCEPNFEELLGVTIPIVNNPHLQTVLAQENAVVTPLVEQEPLLESVKHLCHRYQIKSMLAVKTSYQGKTNGLLSLHQCDDYRQWTSTEITLFEAVAAQLGIALAQAKSLETEQRQKLQLDSQNQQLQQEIALRETVEIDLRRKVTAIETANIGIAIFEDDHYIYLNPAHAQILDYQPQELLGKNWRTLYYPEEIARIETEALPILQQQNYWHGQTQVKSKNGKIVDIQLTLTFTVDGDVVCICEDIGERLKAERDLRDTQQRYESLATAAPVGIFRTDAKGEYLYVNKRWCEIAGLTPEVAQGKGWIQGVHPDDRNYIRHQWSETALNNISFRQEYRFLTSLPN